MDVQPKKKKKITQKRKNIPTKINDVFFSHKIRKYIKVLGNGNDVVSCLLYKRKSNQDFITTYLPVSNLLDSYHICESEDTMNPNQRWLIELEASP